ncbi:PaaI family thioesterase [Actinokineospora enzanensis]|uniref:PaaI family thioesterase n=1 Tax=Actinokineospora enzanensis TaxID=155975 RepID=UPI00037B714C|nr:PaaI family thioesterase [Actinokineospora enzanensis]
MSTSARIQELETVLAHGIETGQGVGVSLGVTLESLAEGRAVYYLDPNPATINAMFVVHGGVITTLVDTAMGSAVFTKLGDGALYTTLELKVNFIRTVRMDGSRLTCTATTIHVGRTTATAEARVVEAAGKLVAHGSCTCLLIQPQG